MVSGSISTVIVVIRTVIVVISTVIVVISTVLVSIYFSKIHMQLSIIEENNNI